MVNKKGKLKYSVPRLNTVNLELRDFSYYNNGVKFKKKNADFDFNFEVNLVNKNTVRIFTHYRFDYDLSDDEYFTLYHSDHLVDFKLSGNIPESFDTMLIASFLGTAITMVKGYYDTITKGYYVNELSLPNFSPLEMILTKYEDDVINEEIILTEL